MAIPGREGATSTTVATPTHNNLMNGPTKFDSLLSKIMNVRESVAKYHPALYYGKTKTGKTTLAATYPKPLLLIDVREKGTASIQEIPDIRVFPLERWEELEALYQYLAHSDHGYKTVVIDTITQLQDMAMEKVLAARGATIISSKTQKDWGDAATLLKVWLQAYKDLPMNVVFLAQYKESQNEDVVTSRQVCPSVGPLLMPSVARFVESIVSIIGWVHIDEVPVFHEDTKKTYGEIKHCLVVKPDGIYSAGIRLPNKDMECPDRILDPDFDKIDAILNPKPKV